MIWFLLVALIVIADQLIKYFIVSGVQIGDIAFSILNLIDITYVQNRGAAFSILSGNRVLLSLISIIFCIVVAIYWRWKKPQHKLLCTSLAMMFGGAAGNAIDRICHGYVVDYISTSFIDFPVFNLADIAITVGAALLVIYFIWFDKEDNNAKSNN